MAKKKTTKVYVSAKGKISVPVDVLGCDTIDTIKQRIFLETPSFRYW
jgi:hypothetical protein